MSGPSVPTMVDVRLLPPVLATWVALLVGTAGLVRVGVALLVLVGALAVGTGLLLRGGRVHAPRHALVPAGSVRAALALPIVALAVGLALGAAARGAFDADPLVGLLASGRADLELVVRVDTTPRRDARGAWGVEVDVEHVRVEGRWVDSLTRARVSGDEVAHWVRGSRHRVDGRARAVDSVRAPLAARVRLVASREVSAPAGWDAFAARVRVALRAVSVHLDPADAALVAGMAIGDDSRLPADVSARMRGAALTHLIVVSGAHVAILAGVVTSVVPGGRLPRAGALAVTLVPLVGVVGPEPSVVRAVACTALSVLGAVVGRGRNAPVALLVVTLVCLLVDPWACRSLGFTLSVLATWAVLVLAPAWTRAWEGLVGRTRPWRAGGRLLVEQAAVTVAAQLLVAPVLVLVSPSVPVGGLVANLLVAPVVAPTCVAALAAAVLALPAPAWAQWAASAAAWGTRWIRGVAAVVSAHEWASLPWPEGPRGALVLAVCVGLVLGAGRALAWACRGGPVRQWAPGREASAASGSRAPRVSQWRRPVRSRHGRRARWREPRHRH